MLSFFQASYTMHHESTIPLPPPPPASALTPHQIARLGHRVALDLLRDAPAMIRMNPLVTSLSELGDGDPHAVDHKALSLAFSEADTVTPDDQCQPGWRQYEIHDDLPLPFGYKKEIVYYSAIRGLPGGFEGFTDPGSGVELYGAWKVGIERVRYIVEDDGVEAGKKKEEDTEEAQWETVLLIEELGEVHANWFLAQYIRMTFTSSHRAMHVRFKEEWERRMKLAMAGQ